MNLSSSTSSFSAQASSFSQARPSSPPPGGKEQLSAALESVGVDDSTAANVLEQIDEAISALDSKSSSGSSSRAARRTAIAEVLEANGIDSEEVGEAIRANGASEAGATSGPSGPRKGGRPGGPPPPRPEDADTSEVESALISAGVDESSTDELLSKIVETVRELTSEAGSSVSQDELRSALTSLLEESGADFDVFEQALSSEIGTPGSFLDYVA